MTQCLGGLYIELSCRVFTKLWAERQKKNVYMCKGLAYIEKIYNWTHKQ